MIPAPVQIPIAVVVAASAVSHRPIAFRMQYIATRPMPYTFIESPDQPSSSGGVLRRGQVIWLEQMIQRTRLTSLVQAFVEHVGFVSLDPRLIKMGDGSVLS